LFFEQEIIEEFTQGGFQYVATKTKDEVAVYLKFRKWKAFFSLNKNLFANLHPN
jgi:hypothetical protein